jgi:hypothetical protein
MRKCYYGGDVAFYIKHITNVCECVRVVYITRSIIENAIRALELYIFVLLITLLVI